MKARPQVSSERRILYESKGWWNGETLASRVALHARKTPNRVAVVDGTTGDSVTYGQLHEESQAIASFLHELGVQPGDVVSVQLPNRYETVAVDIGVLATGAILNPLLPNYRIRELRHILERAISRVLFTPGAYRGFDFAAMGQVLSTELPELNTHVLVATESGEAGQEGIWYSNLLSTSPGDTPQHDAADISEMIFTSGTEAQPKAVMHTEQTTNYAVRTAFDSLQMGPDDVVWMPSPVGHSTGLNYGLRLALYWGIPIVLQDQWEPTKAIELITEYNCTYTLAATTFLADLVDAASGESADLSHLRLFGSGGAPVPYTLVRRAAAVGIHVLRLYGSTEALVVSWNRPESPREKLENTDGLTMPHTEVEVRDDDGEVLSSSQPGELFVRGPACSVGYLDSPEGSRSPIDSDGWIRSGDVCTIDSAGYITVVGRRKEIVIRGGLNIAPREIEDFLVSMAEISAAAVIGLPDDRLGEILCACVVPQNEEQVDLDLITGRMRAAGIATYKFPQRMEIFEQFPMTASGKIQKHVLLQQVLARAS